MLTLAQSWAKRLAELREICRVNVERLPADVRRGYRRVHEWDWWKEFYHRAESGEVLPKAVWAAATRLMAPHNPGIVERLRSRNEIARGR
jgi:hypothetical protein